MSTGVDSEQKSGFWNYLGFSSKPRKRSISSISAKALGDPFEKANRYSAKPSLNRFSPESQPTMMAQSQRSRFIKTGAIITLVLLVLFYLSPSAPSVGNVVNGK
jgi:guanosine-diphosphatase